MRYVQNPDFDPAQDAIERDLAEEAVRLSGSRRGRTMDARRASPCPACGVTIQVGEPITKSGRVFVHAACAGLSAAAPGAKAERKPRGEDPDPYVVRYAGKFTKGGPWVVGSFPSSYGYATEEEAKAAAGKKKAKADKKAMAIAFSASSGRWGHTGPSTWKAAEQARYDEKLLEKVQHLKGAQYNRVEIMRLLDRASLDALPYLERMLDRMLERQTADERAAKDAKYVNATGFSKPDSFTAEKLKAALAIASPAEKADLQYRISEILAKYSGEQLLDIMNKGALEKGVALRTNPSKAASRRAQARWSAGGDWRDATRLPSFDDEPNIPSSAYGRKSRKTSSRSRTTRSWSK